MCAAPSTALCSIAETVARITAPRVRAASAAPTTARLSDSVPPDVKNTWVGSAPRALATCRRACSRPARAARPKRWALDGLPKVSPRYGSTASRTSGRTGVVAAWSRYTDSMGGKIALGRAAGAGADWLHALHFQLHDVVHQERLVGEEGLPVAPPDERAGVRVLGLDQRVEVLARGEDLARRLRAVELARVAADGRELAVKLGGDVHHERGLDRVLPVRERVEHLVRPVRRPRRVVPGQARQIAGVPAELGSDPVVGVAADGEGQNDDAGGKMADLLHHEQAGLLAVVEVRVRQARVAAFDHAENPGGLVGLAGAEGRAAVGPALPGGEVEDAGAISRVHGAEQGARARALDVVPVRRDGEDVDGHGGQ